MRKLFTTTCNKTTVYFPFKWTSKTKSNNSTLGWTADDISNIQKGPKNIYWFLTFSNFERLPLLRLCFCLDLNEKSGPITILWNGLNFTNTSFWINHLKLSIVSTYFKFASITYSKIWLIHSQVWKYLDNRTSVIGVNSIIEYIHAYVHCLFGYQGKIPR